MINLKIVVTGAFSSGKTQFCETLAGYKFPHCMPVEDDIGIDYWDFAIDLEHNLRLVTPPGARRMDYMWEIITVDLVGYIVLVDSAKPETFRECRSIWETFGAYAPVPYVIAANKQDLADAWDVEALRSALRFSRETPIIPCVATHKKSVASVLLALCEEVLREIEAPQ